MSDDRAPLRDIRSMAGELAGLGDINRFRGCEQAIPDLVGTRGDSLFLAPKLLLEADGSRAARNDVRYIALEHGTRRRGRRPGAAVFG